MTNTVSEGTILSISEITITPDVNIRELDTDYVSELMQAQSEYGEAHWQTQWKEKPKINQDGILFSGFHTITAAQRNFGNDHEVSFQIVEGNPYLLAACENASHGKRRTNADKRAAVLRWLQDDEGKQWTDSHIAKQCNVSNQMVRDTAVSLGESPSYQRPDRRRYIDKHGNISWMETSKINNTPGESEVSVISGEKTAGAVLKETTLEQLYQNRQDFQTAVSDFAQSGAYLDFAYCRRRIKSLVGLEDATDQGSTDYTQWNLQKIRTQSQIADESVRVIKGYLDEDPKIEGHPVATLLSEMQRIGEIHQSAKLDTYTRPFQHQPLSDAVERIEKLWTADWEAKSDEERLDDLNELEVRLPSLIEAEDTAQTDVLEEDYQQKKQTVKSLWDDRLYVAQIYTGDGDTDLNLHLTLPDLEKGFAENNPAYADAFQSAMKRTSGSPNYQVMLEKILESEDVTLEVLETEHRALITYAGDLRNWQRPDWSPDTNWILPLIAAKKAKAETSSDGVSVAPASESGEFCGVSARKTLPSGEPLASSDVATFREDTVDSLWEQITPAIAAWKSERKGQGVGYASKGMFIDATKRFHDLPQETETDVDLLQKLLSLVSEAYGHSYTFDRYIKMKCDGVSLWKTHETADVPESDSSDGRGSVRESQTERNHLRVSASLADARPSDDESELRHAQEQVRTKRRKVWSCFESEIRVKQGIEISEETFAKAAADFLGLSTIRAEKNSDGRGSCNEVARPLPSANRSFAEARPSASVGLGVEYCFGADKFILGDIENPPYGSVSDCTLADATMWASRFDVIAIALMNMADWVQVLLADGRGSVRESRTERNHLRAASLADARPSDAEFSEDTESESTPTSEPEEPDYEQLQREHVNRLESLPGEIRQLLPTWQQAHGIEGTLTLKLLLNARSQIEFGRERGRDPFYREEMEDLLQRMKSNDKDFVEKVRELLRGSEPAQEQDDCDWETTQDEHPFTVIDRLKDGLKRETHVVDIEAFVEDILHFYNGIDVDELLLSSAETLKDISDFIEGFVDQPFAAWPEYIRNHRSVPKRELVLVAIGINNHTDDEFEVVEFTDESSDEIRCDLNALPEALRTALFKIAAEKVYAEAVKEVNGEGEGS